MRFNDLMATVLAARADGSTTRVILWRQCVDLLAQFDLGDGAPGEDTQLDQVADALEGLRPQISLAQKLASVVELGPRLRSPRLVRLLLADEPPVVVAAMKRARLTETQWSALIPQAGPLARSVLRQRDDMGAEAQRALDLFGTTDLSLADHSPREPVVPEATVAPAEQRSKSDGDADQIRKLVARIERFTSERQARLGGAGGVASNDQHDPPAGGDIEQFSFATDLHGVITSVSGAPHAAAVGLQIGLPSLDRNQGPDGQILGAFKRRSAFRDGRLAIDAGVLSGNWLVNAEPQFDQRSGRFTGYLGTARKAGNLEQAPRLSEMADEAVDQDAATESAASMRQLIHELRTPLNGVMGFAEIIESQLLGPVNDAYRTMAGEIVGDVRVLVDILDDLDYASRNDGYRPAAGPGDTDMARLLQDAIARFALDSHGNPRIQLSNSDGLPFLNVAQPVAERIIMHFVRALTACVGNETLTAQCRNHFGSIELMIARPGSMMGLSDAQLFDSGYEHLATSPHAPVLGVGFALRLVRRLAHSNNGSFVVFADHFSLILPSGRHDLGEHYRSS